MSTRCQLGIYSSKKKKIKEYDVLLYRHWDGYPEGVLPDIIPFLREFSKKRGIDDTESCAAWLLHEMISKVDKESEIKFLGYGICGDKELHRDIEYFYRIEPDVVKVYKTVYDYKTFSRKGFKLIKKVKL